MFTVDEYLAHRCIGERRRRRHRHTLMFVAWALRAHLGGKLAGLVVKFLWPMRLPPYSCPTITCLAHGCRTTCEGIVAFARHAVTEHASTEKATASQTVSARL
jgi:hypothetical protein